MIEINKHHYNLIGALASGIAIGAVSTQVVLKKKFQEAATLEIDSMRNAFEVALDAKDGEIREVVDTLEDILSNDDTEPIDEDEAPDYVGKIVTTPLDKEPSKNQYHVAVEKIHDPVELQVDSAISDYGVSYIEEEAWQDDDGREKLQIDIMLNGEEPVFVMLGEEISDWDERIGASILVDMFQRCPPGTDPVLYVRNHRTEVDYEVVRVEP